MNEVMDDLSATVQPISLSKKVLRLEAGKKYFSLIEKIRMIAKRRCHAMMAMGDVGVGKSTLVKMILEEEGLQEGKDFVFVRGYTTAMSLYEKLYNHREAGKIVIIDDCDAALRNTTCLDILKAVLDDKYQSFVSYETRRQKTELPKTFTFAGSVIFITNYQPKEKDVHFLAIQDRCLVQRLHLTTREKLEYIKEIIVPEEYKTSSDDDRKKIFDLMEDTVTHGGVHFSYRTYHQLLDFYAHDPENFDIHLRELIPHDTDATLVLRLNKEFSKDPEECRNRFMQLTGKSRRTYFYVLEKVKDFLPKETSQI